MSLFLACPMTDQAALQLSYKYKCKMKTKLHLMFFLLFHNKIATTHFPPLLITFLAFVASNIHKCLKSYFVPCEQKNLCKMTRNKFDLATYSTYLLRAPCKQASHTSQYTTEKKHHVDLAQCGDFRLGL